MNGGVHPSLNANGYFVSYGQPMNGNTGMAQNRDSISLTSRGFDSAAGAGGGQMQGMNRPHSAFTNLSHGDISL